MPRESAATARSPTRCERIGDLGPALGVSNKGMMIKIKINYRARTRKELRLNCFATKSEFGLLSACPSQT